MSITSRLLLALALVPACVTANTADGDVEDGQNDNLGPKSDNFLEGSAEAAAILALVNDPRTDVVRLDEDAGLSSRAAHNIIDGRGMGYATLHALDLVPYVGEQALTALLEYAKSAGYYTQGSSSADFEVSWSLSSVAGTASGCQTGYDTIALTSQRLDASGNPSGAPIIDLYDCAAGHGAASLVPGRYKVWIDNTTSNGMTSFAQSTSTIVDTTLTTSASFSILIDGGYFSLAWDLVGADTSVALTCSDVLDAKGIELVATVANAVAFTSDLWHCEDHFGVTSGLKAGAYTLSVDAFDQSMSSLGTAPALTRSIEPRNKVTHLGQISIPIDGR